MRKRSSIRQDPLNQSIPVFCPSSCRLASTKMHCVSSSKTDCVTLENLENDTVHAQVDIQTCSRTEGLEAVSLS